MYSFKGSFKHLLENINIPFTIKTYEGEILVDSINSENEEKVETVVTFNDKTLIIETLSKYSICLDLLKYCIEVKLNELLKSKEEIISEIIKGQDVSEEVIKEIIPFVLDEFNLINLKLNQYDNNIIERLNEIFQKENAIIDKIDNYIVIVCISNDINETISKIINYINGDEKYYLSYANVKTVFELRDKFKVTKGRIELAKKYQLSSKVYSEKSLLFEEVIDCIDKKEKEKIYYNFYEAFSKFDEELIRTIEIFFNSGLCVSEASEKLYIHRNTLLYRIEKIKKISHYDISKFNEAAEFKIPFLICKSMMNNDIK
ncbi:Hypothetical protein CM240_1998 [Clostridium bornimense]|uniref:PucR C-terminal helix-turn-helix domain-containing protein n=1 Tax=Clostridium bornimense TaxID=1216932 RepID=W6RWV1_9CLOT|nr:helix-turn-helix domain-containing protein [Clostridium bornimense]CDM69156.1 Hypothetical protein CM240_1998 [Clostridium bornimense]